jgi:hypothetical protein
MRPTASSASAVSTRLSRFISATPMSVRRAAANPPGALFCLGG